MPANDWAKIKRIFHDSLKVDASERDSFIEKACDGDVRLRLEVESLLVSLGEAESFLERPVILGDTGEESESAKTPQWRLKTAQEISHYRIEEPIDSGGMGEVYLASDLKLRRKVALKVLRGEVANDRERLKRFRREAEVVSSLNHPNILTVFDFDEVDEVHFFATELVEGETLRSRLKSVESLPLEEAVDIALQTALALKAAHEAGVVHRDIKPENLMIRSDGYVKVLDFGLAKVTESSSPEAPTRAPVSIPGMIMGTAAYMSPEQARAVSIDRRTDIFSLGVVLYEMIAGFSPFKAETLTDTIAAIIQRDPKPPSRISENVPTELDRIVLKMLEKDRGERYQNAADLAVDLRQVRRVLEKEPPETVEATEALTAESPTVISTQITAGDSSFEGSKRSRLIYGLTGLALLLSALALGAYWYSKDSGSRPIESVAVMPFVNESGDPDAEYLSDGITETLISKLSELPKLNVKARASVFRYKGKIADPTTIGMELSVQAVLNGRVVSRGDNLTLFIELVDTATGNRIWGDQYNRKQADLVSMQNDIARDVSQKLKARLSGPVEARLAKSQTSDPEAYQLYLKGRFHLNRLTDDGFYKARDYFQQAIDKDPQYALAYAGLADAYQTLTGWNVLSAAEAMPKADAAVRKAIELDDTLAEAHATFGIVKLFYDRDWQASENEFKRALELNPNYADAHRYYSFFLSPMRRFDEAHAEVLRAQELDPLSVDKASGVAEVYYFQGDFDRAVEFYRKAVDLDPNSGFAHWALANALTQKGSYGEAIEEYKKSIPLSGDSPDEPAMLACAYAMSGNKTEARKILAELTERSRRQYIGPTSLAFVHIALGEKDEAFALLDRAFAERDPLLILLNVEPFFGPVRGDPRFAELVRRVGLPPDPTF